MFSRSFWLSVLIVASARPALGATRFRTTLDDSAVAVAAFDDAERTPRRIRGSLDDAASAAPSPAEPRRIRGSLDEPRELGHASFPLDEGVARSSRARLIRLTLGDGLDAYGFLSERAEPARRLRMTLD